MDETLYYAWERYNDLLFKCPHHDLNCQQKVHIFYIGLDIPTRRVLDSKGFIPLMTPTQALISIQVMAEHSHNWYDETTTRELINDSPNNVDTKKPKENIHDIQANFKNCKGVHLTMEYPLEKEDKEVEQSKYMRSLKETIIKFCENSISKQVADDEWIRKFIKNTDSNIRALKTTTRNLKETQTILTNTGNPYKTRKTIWPIGIPEEIKEDEGALNDGCDIAVEDEEERDYDIPLHEHVMQPLAPQTVHTTPPDDDYVASATNPILNKHLN
ncbi:hypothetical protein Tco_1565612 [Tanacetum coccineum]